MSEIQSQTFEQESGRLPDVFEAAYRRAYILHTAGHDYIKPFEHAELTAVKDPVDDQVYVLGRPMLNSPTRYDILFWLHTYQSRAQLLNYVIGEHSMNVRQSDPSQLYVMSEGEFTPWCDERSDSITQMLLRSRPILLE